MTTYQTEPPELHKQLGTGNMRYRFHAPSHGRGFVYRASGSERWFADAIAGERSSSEVVWRVHTPAFSASVVGVVRTVLQPEAKTDDPSTWVSENLEQLMREFGGQWIALKNRAVIASAEDSFTLADALADRDVENPYVVFIPTEMSRRRKAFLAG